MTKSRQIFILKIAVISVLALVIAVTMVVSLMSQYKHLSKNFGV